MNSQEKMNALRQMLTLFGGMLTMAGCLTASQASQLVSAICIVVPGLITIGSVCGSIYAHWNMVKVHEKTVINTGAVTGATTAVAALKAGVLVLPLLVALSLIALMSHPAFALVRHHRVAAVPVPLSDPRLPANAVLDAGKAAPSAKLTAQQVQQNPLVLIQQFTTNDLNNAIDLANAQTPPDTVAVACWQVLLPIVQAAQTAPGGASAGNALQLGIATGIQDTRDAQSLIANLQSPTGPLAKVNTACAPVVVQLNTTLTLLGVGGGVVAAGGPAAATGAIGALNALLLALPKPIPLPIP
jgi:hypothetical protein